MEHVIYTPAVRTVHSLSTQTTTGEPH